MASQLYGLGTWWMIVKRCQWRCYHVSRLISRQISFKTNTSHFLLKISTSADQRRSDLDHDLISSRLQISARYGAFAGQLMSMEKHFMCFFRIRNIFAFIYLQAQSIQEDNMMEWKWIILVILRLRTSSYHFGLSFGFFQFSSISPHLIVIWWKPLYFPCELFACFKILSH